MNHTNQENGYFNQTEQVSCESNQRDGTTSFYFEKIWLDHKTLALRMEFGVTVNLLESLL